jgi:MFS family permease
MIYGCSFAIDVLTSIKSGQKLSSISSYITRSFPISFWIMCFGSILFCASFQMVIPIMPDYLDHLGGGKYKGFHIAVFAVMALISRPFSGILTDRVGRVPVMVFGAAVCFLMGIGYLWATSALMVMFLRFLHGMSTGFTPTGNTAYVSDLAPADKRGLGMGIHGMSNNIGMAVGPFVGGMLYNTFGFDAVFLASIGIAVLAVLTFKLLPETAPNSRKFNFKMLKIDSTHFYEPKVYGPVIMCFALSFSFGSFLTISPDHSKVLGIGNLGLAFSVLTISSVASRFLIARLSDVYGRVWVFRISLVILCITMLFIAKVQLQWVMLSLVGIWGFCQGAASPTVFAWTSDIAHKDFRGRAYATVFIGLELGIILGGYTSGLIYSNSAGNIPMVYYSNALVYAAAAVFIWVKKVDKVQING